MFASLVNRYQHLISTPSGRGTPKRQHNTSQTKQKNTGKQNTRARACRNAGNTQGRENTRGHWFLKLHTHPEDTKKMAADLHQWLRAGRNCCFDEVESKKVRVRSGAAKECALLQSCCVCSGQRVQKSKSKYASPLIAESAYFVLNSSGGGFNRL